MRSSLLVAMLLAASTSGLLAPSGAHAQGAAGTAPEASYTDTQREGLRLFSQSCGVCHTVVQQRTRQYGPVLSRDTLGGDDELIREYIGNGTPRMPGFRYYFQPDQINDIVAYIKTNPPQVAPAGAGAR
jgi:mono/diheme cytochrome c family protein